MKRFLMSIKYWTLLNTLLIALVVSATEPREDLAALKGK
jgi:hypothetical protein